MEILVYGSRTDFKMTIPLYSDPVKAGFPSPASDFAEKHLYLNEYLISHPAATFFVRVSGDSMDDSRVNDGDVLVVDKALEPRNNDIIVASVNGEFTVKKYLKKGKNMFLIPANKKYKTIAITEGMEFEVWGVVTYVIHKVGRQLF